MNKMIDWSWIHSTFSPICFKNFFHDFFSVWADEKENKLVIGPRQYFSQFATWEKNHNKNSLTKFLNSEFKVGKTIWRIRLSCRADKNWAWKNHKVGRVSSPSNLESCSLSKVGKIQKHQKHPKHFCKIDIDPEVSIKYLIIN